MDITSLSSNISVIHTDISGHPLFEGLWPIPNGVTLNSYLVRSQKTALIDLTADWLEAKNQLVAKLKTAGGTVDYLILNHLEPDHTGYLAEFCAQNPSIEIIATAKGCALVKNFLKADSAVPNLKLRAVKDGDTLDLGNGIVLTFYEVPNVHWPETMVTYESSSGTLFSCDAFGGYGKTNGRIFDDQFSTEEHVFFETESLRYYATIVGAFSTFVNKAIEKLSSLSIKTIAPSHGLVWRKNPEQIINRYKRFAGYNTGAALEHEVCVLCGSMYGNTRRGAEAVIKGLLRQDSSIKVSFFDVPQTEVSQVIAAAFRAKGIVVAGPTYEYKIFPVIAHLLDWFARKRITDKTALRIGSWGWASAVQKEYETLTAPLKWKNIAPYDWQGVPSEADITALEEKGVEFAKLLKA